MTDELPLRGEIFEELKCCAVSNIPRKISNVVELMKLAALVEDFPPEPDRIHLSNGTLFLDGTFAEGKPKIVRNRFPVAYNPNAPKPVLWLQFLDGLLYPEDIPTLVRAGYTMQELVDRLHEEYGWSDSVSNLSAKLQRESIRYKEVVELADVLGYDIVWQKRRDRA